MLASYNLIWQSQPSIEFSLSHSRQLPKIPTPSVSRASCLIVLPATQLIIHLTQKYLDRLMTRQTHSAPLLMFFKSVLLNWTWWIVSLTHTTNSTILNFAIQLPVVWGEVCGGAWEGCRRPCRMETRPRELTKRTEITLNYKIKKRKWVSEWKEGKGKSFRLESLSGFGIGANHLLGCFKPRFQRFCWKSHICLRC